MSSLSDPQDDCVKTFKTTLTETKTQLGLDKIKTDSDYPQDKCMSKEKMLQNSFVCSGAM